MLFNEAANGRVKSEQTAVTDDFQRGLDRSQHALLTSKVIIFHEWLSHYI